MWVGVFFNLFSRFQNILGGREGRIERHILLIKHCKDFDFYL